MLRRVRNNSSLDKYIHILLALGPAINELTPAESRIYLGLSGANNKAILNTVDQ